MNEAGFGLEQEIAADDRKRPTNMDQCRLFRQIDHVRAPGHARSRLHAFGAVDVREFLGHGFANRNHSESSDTFAAEASSAGETALCDLTNASMLALLKR